MNRPAFEAAPALLALRYPPEQVAARARLIYEALLRPPSGLGSGNFVALATGDLALLFDLYDGHFFQGGVRRLLDATSAPLTFHLSRRLTRSAGTTKRLAPRGLPPGAPGARYEIAISTALLGQTFRDVERSVAVNGLECRDRLEALQRVFEHELVHLVEMLVWGVSSCARDNFRALAGNWFAHTDTRHDLITQRERARVKFDLRVGDAVAFDFEGRPFAGVLNRITRRATVLVESADGEAYSDGKRYRKYYVPLQMLRKAGPGGT
jgi:hypothetical protein